MPLLIDLARSFPSVVRQRGDWLYRGGSVKIVSGNQWDVEALVKGSIKYEVSLRRSNDVVRVNCTCPYFATEGPCKHIWAALLASSDRGYLDAAAEGKPARIVEDWELNPDTAPPPKPPAWKKILTNIHAQGQLRPYGEPEPWPPYREVFYIVDPSTVAGGVGSSFSFKVEVRDRSKTGKPGKLKELKMTRKQIVDITEERDRNIIAALAGATQSPYSYMGNVELVPHSYSLSLPLGLNTLRDLCQSGRCLLRREYREQPERMQRVKNMVASMDKEVFGPCTNYGECQEACPKGISISFIAQMNRYFFKSNFIISSESTQ